MINKFIAAFLVIFLISRPSYGQEQPDYEHLNSGDCVSQNGFFFTETGMIKLATNVEEKTKLAVLEKQKQIDLLKIDLDSCIKSKQTELLIQKEMFERQLITKQAVIDAYKNEAFWGNVKLIGYTVAALGIGVAVGAIFIK